MKNSVSNKLSGVVITFNEEENIEACIVSLQKVCDEIVVVDSFSTDKTQEICLSMNAVSFYSREWKGYAESKNTANELAEYNYVLSLDADEVLSNELVDAILALKKVGFNGTYSFNRLNHYGNRAIKTCGWYPDAKPRLFDSKRCNWKNLNAHEILNVPKGMETIHINGDLHHYTFSNYREHKKKVFKYSKLAAEQKKGQNKLILTLKMLISPMLRFIKNYVAQKGFLDGSLGFSIAYLNAKEVFLKYYYALKLK